MPEAGDGEGVIGGFVGGTEKGNMTEHLSGLLLQGM